MSQEHRKPKKGAAAPADPTVPARHLFPPHIVNELMGWKGASKIGPGLANLGNTCFMNSVLQCLTYTAPLANFLLSEAHSKTCKISGFCALCAFEKHVALALQSGGKQGYIAPKSFAHNLKSIGKHFRLGRQEDAHEFARYLLDNMHICALKQHEKPGTKLDTRVAQTTVIGQIFGGLLRSQVLCSVCSHPSDTFDFFMDIALDLHGKTETLHRALEHFTKAETLDGSNKYRCSRCTKLVKASKRLTIHKPPPILTLQLKRFDFMGNKINKFIQFPEQLDISPFISSREGATKPRYRLAGVVVHDGFSSRSGHYYAFVRSPSNAWHRMDDSFVTPVSLETVMKQRAYILLYEAVHSSNAAAPSASSTSPAAAVAESPLAHSPASLTAPTQKSPASRPTMIKEPAPSPKPTIIREPTASPHPRDSAGPAKKKKTESVIVPSTAQSIPAQLAAQSAPIKGWDDTPIKDNQQKRKRVSEGESSIAEAPIQKKQKPDGEQKKQPTKFGQTLAIKKRLLMKRRRNM